MALSRRTGNRFQASIWPGFVDAMTGLLLVLMFVLTIFMIVQFVLRETITGQETELNELSAEVAALAQALGLEQDRSATLTERVGALTSTLGEARSLQQEQAALITTLQTQTAEQENALDTAAARIVSFEEQVAGLLAQRDDALGQVAQLEGAQAELLDEQQQLQVALAGLRDQIDAQTEAARLAAARRDALQALIADLRQQNTDAAEAQVRLTTQVDDLQTRLSDEEAARLVEAAAAEALRERLANADTELTAMTLALEEQRRRAEETLTQLAAAQAVTKELDLQLAAALVAQQEVEDLQAQRDTLQAALDAARSDGRTSEELRRDLAAALAAQLAAEERTGTALSDAERQEILLGQAQTALDEQTEIASESQRQQALLNQQVAALRAQLGEIQAFLDEAEVREAASEVQLQSLGNELNTALARVAAEERRRRELEEAERARLEAERALLESENQDLARYRSEFFGELRDLIGAQDGVRVVGDRFVFSSEVLFAPGAANLSPEGQADLASVANILRGIANDIPPEIDWVIQVDGHTDTVPIAPGGTFSDNWELSQARALSVVLYMINELDIPPQRLSANGFGEHQPIAAGDAPEALAQNRRIELKLTEK